MFAAFVAVVVGTAVEDFALDYPVVAAAGQIGLVGVPEIQVGVAAVGFSAAWPGTESWVWKVPPQWAGVVNWQPENC